MENSPIFNGKKASFSVLVLVTWLSFYNNFQNLGNDIKC